MHIAIIDADLIYRAKHRFPNLACMKLSGYHKSKGDSVELKMDYDDLTDYDRVYISKVFTDTLLDLSVLDLPNVEYGGTGFFYDKAAPLPYEIEHHMPDYHLYDKWVECQLSTHQGNRKDYKYYLDYSIGFMTRGCFRQCEFCVNKNYEKVYLHSPLDEFFDPTRKKICLLDDNFLGCSEWERMLVQLQATKRPFQFKQGLDERLLTSRKCELLFKSKYDGDYIFAFDNMADYDLIKSKLGLLRQYTDKIPKFYCFCGFDRNDKWGSDFWQQDLWDLFKRIHLLMQYNCLPYIMRFNRYVESPYRGIYVVLARWCNQPSFFKKLSLREFCIKDQHRYKTKCSSVRYMEQVEKDMPALAQQYFDIVFGEHNIIQ